MTTECSLLCSEILRARGTGRVVCGELSESSFSVSRLAGRFDLDSDPANYRACSTREALFIAVRVISHHLVDDGPLVPLDRSESLAADFLSRFPPLGTSFFTNGEFSFIGSCSYLKKWRQVTPERSSSGLLVLADPLAGVLWVADKSPRESAA